VNLLPYHQFSPRQNLPNDNYNVFFFSCLIFSVPLYIYTSLPADSIDMTVFSSFWLYK
jgi:hypothetical protein